jgi:hypothetical protein
VQKGVERTGAEATGRDPNMRRWLLGSSVALILAANAAVASAQQPLVHNMGAPAQENTPVAYTQVPPGGTPSYNLPYAVSPISAADVNKGPIKTVLNKHGNCCFATHNSVGCTSAYAQYIFFFGSCRQFFGEPCLAYPPRPPHPLQNRGGAAGAAGGGCASCGP